MPRANVSVTAKSLLRMLRNFPLAGDIVLGSDGEQKTIAFRSARYKANRHPSVAGVLSHPRNVDPRMEAHGHTGAVATLTDEQGRNPVGIEMLTLAT